MIREKGDEIFEMVESSMWESALRTTKTLTNELETTYGQIEHDDKLDKSKCTDNCISDSFLLKPKIYHFYYSYNQGITMDSTCF
jgi:hypothetical protein